MRDAQIKQIADFAVAQRLPALGPDKSYAEAGILLSFGPKEGLSNTRAAALVDKILKGAKPADLPVERPTLFELVVNLKTARATGITLRPGCLDRVDAAIQ